MKDSFLCEEHKRNYDTFVSECNNIENGKKNIENLSWLKEQAKKYNIKIKDSYFDSN